MRKILSAIVVGAAVAAATVPAVSMTGCAAVRGLYGETEAEVFTNINEDFTVIVDSLTILYELGEIDEQTWRTIILPLIEEGNEFLDAWSQAIVDGRSIDRQTYRSAVRGIITRLTVYLATEG